MKDLLRQQHGDVHSQHASLRLIHREFEYYSHGEKGEGKGGLQKRKYGEDQGEENRVTFPTVSKTRRCSTNT